MASTEHWSFNPSRGVDFSPYITARSGMSVDVARISSLRLQWGRKSFIALMAVVFPAPGIPEMVHRMRVRFSYDMVKFVRLRLFIEMCWFTISIILSNFVASRDSPFFRRRKLYKRRATKKRVSRVFTT